MINLFYERIAKDSKQIIIHLVSEAGHGKSTSLRSIVDYIIKHNPNIVWKCFDCSQAWYHNAPLEHRQLVTRERIAKQQVVNLDNCVYEVGKLSKEEKRAFIGEIMTIDYNKRYDAKLEGRLDEFPLMLYIFEEADVIFSSYSFRTNDKYSPVFQNYVSVGRNYKMRGFLISTAEQGEISPSLRRRTRKIYGRVISKGDLSAAKRNGITEDLTTIPRYHFHYQGITQRIPDVVTHTPVDYVVKEVPVVVEKPGFDAKWWAMFAGALLVLWLLGSWIMGV